MSVTINTNIQMYKGIPLECIDRGYGDKKAKRFVLNGTNQNVWIPNKHLDDDGTIKLGENIDYVFNGAQNQLRIAGVIWPHAYIEPRLPFDRGDMQFIYEAMLLAEKAEMARLLESERKERDNSYLNHDDRVLWQGIGKKARTKLKRFEKIKSKWKEIK